MNKEEIISGSILMAKFCGYRINDNLIGTKSDKKLQIDFKSLDLSNSPQYHENWNWIIPVAKKCILSYHDNRQSIFSSLHDVDIENLFKSCVVFINWYYDNEKDCLEYIKQKESI